MYKYICLILIILCLSGCDLFEFHPYDVRLSKNTETDINRKNIERIKAICENKDTIRFVLMGDTQGWLDETNDFVKHLNQTDSVDFVIHAGDIADFGLTKEFEWMHNTLSKLRQPYIALIGNHDIMGNGEYVYKKMYGEEDFSFIVEDIKFICLNTNALEYDYSKPIPDFIFLQQELLDSSDYNRTIVVMHAPPGSDQFNNNVKEIFQIYIKLFPSLQFCLHGHEHSYKAVDIFNDGIIYYGCSSIKRRNYLLFTLTKDNYSHELIRF